MAIDRPLLVLSLALTPGIGGKTITRILVRNDLLKRSPSAFLDLSAEVLREEYRMTRTAAENWVARRKEIAGQADHLRARLMELGVRVITAADAAYPTHLEDVDRDPPGVLFVYGNDRLLKHKTFAVVASRKASDAALQDIERLTEDGVLAGETLVSGHSTPEYQRAAVVPLRWGAPRLLVLDTGLFEGLGDDLRDEPFAAARLWRYQFDPKTDLAVSAINPLRDYHPNANRIRDRLVVGLAQRLDIAHLNAGGNMEGLAIAALKAGRLVRVMENIPDFARWQDQGARVCLRSG